MHINKISYLSLVMVSSSLMGMDQNGQNDVFYTHLKNKRDALARVHEEVASPYQESNREAYKQNKLNKAISIAESNRQATMVAATLAGLAGIGLAIPTLHPNTFSDARFVCGGFSLLSFMVSGAAFYNWWNYTAPTMADVAKRVQAKLIKPYDGKRIMRKKLGMNHCYLQPQAAQNPHNK